MNELNHLQIELSGRNLIEASAGTGKTYAIACLYLRILVEQGLTPEQILVVTYTEAATKELRGRIRSRIREALEVFSGTATDDAFLLGLYANSNGNGPGLAAARDNLERALTSFDTASIFTIHGFCLRALQDNAFESGSLYDTALVTDQSALLKEVVDDFWRVHFFSEPAPLLLYALHKNFSPDYLLGFLQGMLTNPKLEVMPRFSASEIVAIEERCRSVFAGVREEWFASREEIIDILTNDKGLSRAAGNYHPDELVEHFESMDSFHANDNPFALFPGFHRFSTAGIVRGKKPTGTAPEHTFFDLCEDLCTSVEERFLALRWELVEFARQRLPSRKREMNIRFFDDLLSDLYAALCSESGRALAASLNGKYRAALIDEFQDTDPVQFEIFRKVYTDTTCPLFLIGDPKQAIYAFRGADIFAYLEAAADVEEERRFTLTDNWRSTPELLTAFNMVFGNGARPFVFDAISYHPVKSGKKEGEGQFVCPERDSSPLQLWCLPTDEKGGPLNIGKATVAIPPAIAAEISRLLQDGLSGKALVGDRPLLPGDIAVIVRSHRQAGAIQEALRGFGIPSVMRSDKSIFTTDEAGEVCTLLGALGDPGSEAKVRAALVTDLLGMSGNDIADLLEDEQGWEECLGKFRDYNHLWLESGFMVMSRALLAREKVRGRLLCRPDGERRLTNVLHCFEVIHQAAHEKGLGLEGLLTWFGERVTSGEKAEENQIRLETDEKMVKIVTVHVSKGLEYPVVFCPFMWGGIKGSGEVVTFHDKFSMVKDFGSADYELHRGLAQKESLAESLRLLYVALTRAKFRCYLLGGKVVGKKGVNEPETSPLAYLFHASEAVKSSGEVIDSLKQEVGKLSREQMAEQLLALAEKGEGAIAVAEMPDSNDAGSYTPMRDDGVPFAARVFSGKISSDWRVASFTSFAAPGDESIELPDRDAAVGETIVSASMLMEEKPAGMNIFTFPRGAQAGIFLHSLFEELDFPAAQSEKVSSLVGKGLERYGYAREWEPCITSLVNNVIATPLSSPEGPFSLTDLKQGCWLAELEFFFPLKFVSAPILRECLRQWSGTHVAMDIPALCQGLKFRPAEGMVRGFMDMVFEHKGRFYLLDWKSNHLGYRIEDYGIEALKAAMMQHLYPLQYLLYTVALNRYLGLRVKGYDYASHFGGAIYVFLRGVSPERGEEFGVFRDTPPAEMINELTACLIKAGG
jgi:exodeoxyribonuclease V beta subunit